MVIVAMLLPIVGLKAQQIDANTIYPDNVVIRRDGSRVFMTLDINVDRLDLSSQQMVVITPVAVAADNSNIYRFNPVVVTGSKRERALERAVDFNNFKFDSQPQQIIRRENGKSQSVPVSYEFPYAGWLHNANLVFEIDRIGCACKNDFNNRYTAFSPILPVVVDPKYDLTYVTPPVEEIKQRSETYTARLNFEVGKYQLLRNFKNNATVLDEVDRIISEIRNDANLTVKDFSITGYASPEGNPQSNMTLSENRAKAFVSYLRERYNIKPSDIKTDWKGEDWDGLRKAVVAGDLSNKQAVLDVLDNETDVMRRKTKVKQLAGGETYRVMLRDYYPPLRRNDYTISYVARKFDVNEAKELIKTKPQHLSQNEMFLVANTYPKNSKEFKEVFDIAVRLYPNNPHAQLNSAALEVENGSLDVALDRLKNIDMPEAWNNLGIIYFKKGDYGKAEEFFNKAANAGLKTASDNLLQFSKWKESQM
jgi:Outer membrane protein and related peptidoglycan-associated (lipo)proteins